MQPTVDTREAAVTAPGEGEIVRWFADTIEIKSRGESDVCEIVMHAGCEPPMHAHDREEESFYVLEGTLTFFTADGEVRGGPGTFVQLPRGVAHTYAVDSGTARALVTATPSGFAAMFADVGERLGGDLPDAPAPEHFPILAEALAGYGISILGPNPRYS